MLEGAEKGCRCGLVAAELQGKAGWSLLPAYSALLPPYSALLPLVASILKLTED